MLTIDLVIHGKEKDTLPQERKHIAFDRQLNSIGTRGEAHSVFGYWATTEYMNIFGVSGAVSIDTTINVEKRKLTKQTIEQFEKEFIPRIFRSYENSLDDILITATVCDDTGRKFEKEYTL